MEVEPSLDPSLSSITLHDISSPDERWRWTVVRSCLQEKPLFDHQLHSYNDFISRGLQSIIDEDPVLEVISDSTLGAVKVDGSLRRARIRFGQVTVVKPTIRAKPPRTVVAGGGARQDDNRDSAGCKNDDTGGNDGFGKATGSDDNGWGASGEGKGWESPKGKKDDGWGASGEGKGWDSLKGKKDDGWGASGEDQGLDALESKEGGGWGDTENWEQTKKGNKSSGWGNGESPNAWEDGGKDKADLVELQGRSKKENEFWEKGKNFSGLDEVAYGAKASKGKCQVGDDEVAYGSKAFGGKDNIGWDEVAYGLNASMGKDLAADNRATCGSSDGEGEDAKARRKVKGKGKMEEEEEVGSQRGGEKVQGASKRKSRNGDGLDKPGNVRETGRKRKFRKDLEKSDTEAEEKEADLYPREARLRNLTYAAQILIDIRIDIYVPAEVGTSKDGSCKDGRSKDGRSKDGRSKDGRSKDGRSKDGLSKDGLSKDGLSKDGLSKDGLSKDGLSKDGLSKDGLSKDGRSKDGRSKDCRSKDGLSKEDGSVTAGEKIIETREHLKTPIGKIPVMVKSELCHLSSLDAEKSRKEDCAFDVGGYFIVRGAEKVLLAQEQSFMQRITVSQNDSGLVASSAGAYYQGTNIFYRTNVFMRRQGLKKGNVRVSGPQVCTVRLRRVDGYIPVVVVMRALGVVTDKEVLEILCGDLEDHDIVQLAFPLVRHADKEMEAFLQERGKDLRNLYGQESSLEFIGSKVKGRQRGETECESAVVALSDLFPAQQGLSDSSKAFTLGYMAYRLCCCFLGRCDVDDRENLRNKRLDLPGDLLMLEFRNLLSRFKNEVRKRTQKSLAKKKVEVQWDSTVFTLGFQRAFSTGDWSARGGRDARNSGVVVDLPRINPMSTHGQLRKIRTPVNYIAKATKVRYIHDSHKYRVCILETPDGENCGLVESLALSCFVSGATPEKPVYDSLLACRMKMLDMVSTQWLCSHVRSYKVFLNGKWVGCHRKPDRLVTEMRTLRRQDKAMAEVEIVQDKMFREIRIYTDAGRMLRPLLLVENGTLKISPRHLEELHTGCEQGLPYLLKEGVLEFLGVEEEEGALIASNKEELKKAHDDPSQGSFTHFELHDLLLVGLGASVIPFFNHNPSTRDMQQAQKHGKQAIGHYTTNRRTRCDTSGQELFYPQNQLVKTGAATALQKDELVNGQNVIVAVACYTGYNQEDSLIMNKSSLDRGLFRTVHYKTHRSTLRKGTLEEFRKPDLPEEKVAPKKVMEAYEMVESDGFPYVGARLNDGDFIVAKVRPDETNLGQTKDVLEKVTLSNRGRVDQVIQTTEEDGTIIAKVRMRSCRRPEIGDKFSSLHGQKGVIGMLFEQEDMPFTKDGIVPDIIINPHAFPSRQTLGQLMESLLGKAVASPHPSEPQVGRADATPFASSLSQDVIFRELHKSGYHRFGKECMYNGHTGCKMEALITIGPTFYQRLTHLVADKVKFRGSRGFVHPLTRQPVKAREKHGAVKFGAMEQDCMMAHGAAMTLRERTFLQSDFYRILHCKRCQLPAFMNNQNQTPTCRVCTSPKDIVQLEVPYACKLLQQELFSMGISLTLISEPC